MESLKIVGVVLLVIAAVCLFVAFERYQSNAENVRAANHIGGGLLRSMTGGELAPSTPAATKYALLFAVICGGGGGYCLWKPKGSSQR
jgi:hypothetical protein